MNLYDYKEIESRRGLGEGEHFAVIVFESITPHGGEQEYQTLRYLRFDSEKSLSHWVESRFARNFAVIRATPLEVSRTVTIGESSAAE